jgi:hypothetical protein
MKCQDTCRISDVDVAGSTWRSSDNLLWVTRSQYLCRVMFYTKIWFCC